MFNKTNYESLIAKQPLLGNALKILGQEYLDFSLGNNTVNEAHLRRFYNIVTENRIFSGSDIKTSDVEELLKHIG